MIGDFDVLVVGLFFKYSMEYLEKPLQMFKKTRAYNFRKGAINYSQPT